MILVKVVLEADSIEDDSRVKRRTGSGGGARVGCEAEEIVASEGIDEGRPRRMRREWSSGTLNRDDDASAA
jgi:hypothetical protein